MKRNLFCLTLLSLLFTFSSVASAQENKKRVPLTPEQRMEIKAQKVSKELMLDEATSAKFKSLYQEYVKALAACRCDFAKGSLTDEQILKNLEKRYEMQEKVAAVNKDYVSKFAKILTPRQVQKLFSDKNNVRKFQKAPARRNVKAKSAKAEKSSK